MSRVVPTLLVARWMPEPRLLGRRARRVYDAALATGWSVTGIRYSQWRTSDETVHTSTGFGLVDPADGHGEADGIWTDDLWDWGRHYVPGMLPKVIGARQFKALAELPPGRYVREDGDSDGQNE